MKKGFTLIETLVAISVLSLSLAGILSLSSISIRSSAVAVDQIKALFLANEGIEYVRNKRDSNILKGEEDWLDGLDNCFISENPAGCYIDVFPAGHAFSACLGGTCPKLRFSDTFNRFNYDASGKETKFVRKISIETIVEDEIRVISEISWSRGGEERGFSLNEHLFNLAL